VIDDDYMIVQSRISNEEQFGKYRQAVMPLIERFGGKHVRGGAALATGRDDPQRARPVAAVVAPLPRPKDPASRHPALPSP
jgi:uncharacterized protein (DUF1330 family)